MHVKVLTVSDKFNEHAHRVVSRLRENEIRAEADLRSESIPKKIRDAEKQKIPYIIVIGEKEVREGVLAVRKENSVDDGVKLEVFLERILREIEEKE